MPVKVSVIVPVYNPGTYIDECIASILRQSLPVDEYEAIFVDDGSTDGTGARLDALAAQHANITAIHIPNSGWPGRPRNVGIDAAVGRYVYFVDNDDWIGDEALERLDERAERNDADVVVGKEVGHGKGVPRPLFRRNVDDATLTGTPLLDLLTPHKLFRRSFLDEHGIRFPEGPRRLEDHVFVMKAFFSARRISILADYPCYHWLLREDASNATDRYAEPVAYYQNVREVLDVVDEYTEPGPARDRFYAHWYRGKGLHRLRGGGWAEGPDEYELEVFSEVRRLALERFGPGVAQGLAARFRVISRSVLADRPDLVSVQARIELGMRVEVALISIDCVDTRLRLSLSATLTYADDTPIKLARRSGRIYWQLPAPLAGDSAILDEDLDV
ncbi:MAG: glycosyltransferase, partial [Candidatus Limnocylindria bacterium]